MDDRRAGLVLRALRRRRGSRQADLARVAGVSQSLVSRTERGHADALSLRAIRGLFAAVDARSELDIRWRGGELDRLIDEGHAQLAMDAATELEPHEWELLPEVPARAAVPLVR